MQLALLALLPSVSASELVWDGYYRGRGLFYDSLSLSDSNVAAEGGSQFLDHRLLLQPSFLISEHAALHAQIDVFAYTLWGDRADTYVDPVTGETIAIAQADGVASADVGLRATRAWGEAITPIGRFAAGRMPMHWGSGILWNNGDAVDAEYGDTADRVQFNTRVGPVFVLAAWDVQFEGFLGEGDDMQSASLALGYRSETAGVGLLNNYRYQTSQKWQAYTGDVWGFADLGPVRIELEGVGVFGGGNLDTGANDVTVMAFGAMLNAAYKAEKLGLGIEAGVATGDADPTDKEVHAFSFDRDHNVALLLFEEPLPTLQTTVLNETNQGRTTDAAISGEGISNALYLRPHVSYKLMPELEAELGWITATQAKGPASVGGRGGYGNEIDLSLRYDPFPHVWVQGTAGILLPGKYYSLYENTDFGSGFDKSAFAGRLLGVIEF